MDQQTAAFAEEVRRFCAFIEGGPSNRWLFSRDCLVLVLRLHESALRLPVVNPGSGEPLGRIGHDAWQAVRKKLELSFMRDYYWEVFEAFEPFEDGPPEPTLGSLSDDLADIWREIKDGLLELEQGGPASLNAVVWHWRFGFESHWGRHAAGAIAALTSLCFGAFADLTRPAPLP